MNALRRNRNYKRCCVRMYSKKESWFW
jgi:hypothetical protein